MGKKHLVAPNPDAPSPSARLPRGEPVEWVYAGSVLLASIYERSGVISALAADSRVLGQFHSRAAARRAVFLATLGGDSASGVSGDG
jgi:hypothetical protein